MFGVFALESPYIEKNKDWSSQTSHKKFGGSCPKKYTDTNKKKENKDIFNFYIFYYSQINSINYISVFKTLI